MTERLPWFRPPCSPCRSGVAWQRGFRPFFLVLPVWLCLSLAAWVGMLAGFTRLAPVDALGWHAHEMLIGLGGGLLAGFLLTSARAWTGRPTAEGRTLAALVALWSAGRVLAWFAVEPLAALADVALLLGVAVAIGRPILATRSGRNLGFPALLCVLGAADLAMHAGGSWTLAGRAVGVTALACFLLGFGGRIIPLFTRNSLQGVEVRGADRRDRLALGALLPLLALEGAVPLCPSLRPALAVALLLAGTLHLVRMKGWRSLQTLKSPLLWTLHLGFAATAAAFVWRGAAVALEVPPTTAIHLFGVGGLLVMALAMMTRVSLGHTGRDLTPPRLIQIGLVAVPLAAFMRVTGGLTGGEPRQALLRGAAVILILVFASWSVTTAPWLLAPRTDGKGG